MFFVTGRYSNRMEFKVHLLSILHLLISRRYSNRMEFKGCIQDYIYALFPVDIATEWNLKEPYRP